MIQYIIDKSPMLGESGNEDYMSLKIRAGTNFEMDEITITPYPATVGR